MRDRRGFSLIEILVATAVLTLLVGIVSQIIGNTSKTVLTSTRRLDADSEARAVFDRMAQDFNAMIARPDVGIYMAKESGNDRVYFFSQAPGYADSSLTSAQLSPLSLVGYRINGDNQLERLGKNLTWDGRNANTAASPGSPIFGATSTDSGQLIQTHWSQTVASGSTDTDYHLIGPQVFRIEFAYLLKNGTYTETLNGSQTINDVAAIIVAIAILDENSRKLVNSGQITSMASTLTDPSGLSPAVLSSLMGPRWQTAINSSIGSIPRNVTGQIRIYQRYFYLKRTYLKAS